MREAFEGGGIVTVECIGNPHYMAHRVRDALNSLVEFPQFIPEGCRELVVGKRFMVKARMRDGIVELHPRGEESVIMAVGVRLPGARPAEGPVVVNCKGKDLTVPSSDLIWLLDRLSEGSREFTDFHSETPLHELRERFGQLGYGIEEWQPPERVVFSLTK